MLTNTQLQELRALAQYDQERQTRATDNVHEGQSEGALYSALEKEYFALKKAMANVAQLEELATALQKANPKRAGLAQILAASGKIKAAWMDITDGKDALSRTTFET